MKNPTILALVIALMLSHAAYYENSVFMSVSRTPDEATDTKNQQSDNPPDNDAISDSPLVGP